MNSWDQLIRYKIKVFLVVGPTNFLGQTRGGVHNFYFLTPRAQSIMSTCYLNRQPQSSDLVTGLIVYIFRNQKFKKTLKMGSKDKKCRMAATNHQPRYRSRHYVNMTTKESANIKISWKPTWGKVRCLHPTQKQTNKNNSTATKK